MIQRRRFLLGLTGLICAPAIIRASSLMAVKPWLDDGIAMWSISHPPSASMVPYDLNPDSMVEFTIDNLLMEAQIRWSRGHPIMPARIGSEERFAQNPGWWRMPGA